MGNALLNQVVHALQQLQGHHGSQARTGSLLLKVLAQGTWVAGRTGQNVWGFTIPWPPSLLGPGLSSSGASTIFPGILSDLTHPDPQSHGSATLQLLRSVSAVAGIERGHRREGSYKGAKSTGWEHILEGGMIHHFIAALSCTALTSACFVPPCAARTDWLPWDKRSYLTIPATPYTLTQAPPLTSS